MSPTLHMTASACIPRGTSCRPPVYADSFHGPIRCPLRHPHHPGHFGYPSTPQSPRTAIQHLPPPTPQPSSGSTRRSVSPQAAQLKHFTPRPDLHLLIVSPPAHFRENPCSVGVPTLLPVRRRKGARDQRRAGRTLLGMQTPTPHRSRGWGAVSKRETTTQPSTDPEGFTASSLTTQKAPFVMLSQAKRDENVPKCSMQGGQNVYAAL